MPVVNRGFTYHYIYEDYTVAPLTTVVLAHNLHFEADLAIINFKSGNARLIVLAIDSETITLRNPSPDQNNVSDIVLEFWHSIPK